MTTNSLVFFEINNYGTCISTEHNLLGWFLWLKHVNVGVTEIEDVLGVMCLHQNGRCSRRCSQQL